MTTQLTFQQVTDQIVARDLQWISSATWLFSGAQQDIVNGTVSQAFVDGNLDINEVDMAKGILNSGVRRQDLQRKAVDLVKSDFYADGVYSATWDDMREWAHDAGMLDEAAYMLYVREGEWATAMNKINAPHDPIDGP